MIYIGTIAILILMICTITFILLIIEMYFKLRRFSRLLNRIDHLNKEMEELYNFQRRIRGRKRKNGKARKSREKRKNNRYS